MIYAMMRGIFVIMIPIIGVAIYQILDKNSDNSNAVADYTVVSSCMDQYSQLDFSEVDENLNQQNDIVDTLKTLWWISMAFVFLEILAFVVLKIRNKRNYDNDSNAESIVYGNEEVAQTKESPCSPTSQR